MSDRSDLEANNLKLGAITNKVVNMPNYLDTSDATALAGDIMVNKTAYVNGIKIEGTIPNNGTLNYSPMITVQNIPSGFTTGGTIGAVTSSIDVNISAENIKNGVNILGVVGNLSEGIDTSDADATVEDLAEGVTAYVNGVKLTGMANTGIMNIADYIYITDYDINTISISGKTSGSDVSHLIYPNSSQIIMQVLKEDMATYANLTPNILKQGVNILGVVGNLSSGIDTSDANAVARDIVAEQTAYVNGVKLVGTLPLVSTPVPLDMNTVNYVSNSYFRIDMSSPSYLQRMYFAPNSPFYAPVQQNYIADAINLNSNQIKNGEVVLGVVGTYDGGSVEGIKQFSSIQEMENSTGNVEGDLAIIYTSTQSNLTEDTQAQFITFPETVVLPTAMEDYMEIGFQAVDTSIMFDCWGQFGPNEYRIDCYTDDGEIRIQYGSEDGVTYTRTYFRKNEEDISGDEMDFGTIVKFGSRGGGAEWNDAIGYFAQTGSTTFEGLYQYKDNSYNLAKTQLTADKEKVYQDVFYGKNGIEVGSLQNITNLSIKQLQMRANIYSDISNLSLNENINSLDNAFKGYTDLVTVPNFDTSNVVRMWNMFYDCSNLATVPNFNMSNVALACAMFYNCQNLTSVPNFNTSNVVNMCDMFYNCQNLTTAPEFNTSNVTDMQEMFFNCYNLTTMPSFNTSNTNRMAQMFRNCYNLTTVPNFDTSNVYDMGVMFWGCNNLSSSSYANIANSLPLAVNLSSSSRNVSNIGLNIENFTLEQKQILGNKGYYDALQYVVNTSNLSTSWNILYL